MLLIWGSPTNDLGGNCGALGLARYWEGGGFMSDCIKPHSLRKES